MRANSDIRPETFIKSKERTQFNYNIIETTKEDMDGTERVSFDYDYIEIVGDVTRDKLIIAMIADKYSKDDELALLHNKMIGKDTDEYDAYIAFRAGVKIIVGVELNE